jgi:hypothetical protein
MNEELSAKLRLVWLPVGSTVIDDAGKLKFPRVSTSPGLYRFRISKLNGGAAIYVGETDNLQRRFAHYRNPGPTQATNLRLNAFFLAVISSGGSIEVDIVIDKAWLTWSDVEVKADFRRKSARRLFENLVLCAERADSIEDLNK